MHMNRFKGCTNTIAGYYIVYIVTENTLDSLSRIVSSVRFKTGGQKDIQVVALNKTETQCTYQCFPPELWEVADITWGLNSQYNHCPREFDRRLWHRGRTIDASEN